MAHNYFSETPTFENPENDSGHCKLDTNRQKLMEPTFRSGTRKAISELAEELSLRYDLTMQDWSYEVANPNDIDKYIYHYVLTTDDDKKFVLMEMLIQATENQIEKDSFYRYWDIVKNILHKDFTIHEYTVYYWSCFDKQNLNDCWTITENMRELWYGILQDKKRTAKKNNH